MNIINSKIAEYTESFTSQEPDIVQRLVQVTEKELDYTDMLSGRQAGILLRILVQVSGARRILEIGTFTGYSAMMMALGMPEDGELITLEKNQRYQRISGPFFSEPPFNEKIFQIMGNALEIIPRLEGQFDLIFLDADKINYPKYYALLKHKIRSGGLLVVDNVLWGGSVTDQSTEKAAAIHTLNEMIRNDENIEQVMLPVRDGVTIARFSG
jgi:caffeoyl-CoA O-methyltransferase